MKIEKPNKQIQFDPDRCEQVYEALIAVFQKHKPTVGEIIIALSNLTYALGASIEGYGEKGPTLEEITKEYYSNPTIGNSLMIQGLTMVTWYDSYQEQVVNIIKENIKNKE